MLTPQISKSRFSLTIGYLVRALAQPLSTMQRLKTDLQNSPLVANPAELTSALPALPAFRHAGSRHKLFHDTPIYTLLRDKINTAVPERGGLRALARRLATAARRRFVLSFRGALAEFQPAEFLPARRKMAADRSPRFFRLRKMLNDT